MPTIATIKGYRFFFFSLDRNEPPHIHVESDESVAKFWLEPVTLARTKGFRQHEIREIRKLVEKHQRLFVKYWYEFFKTQDTP